MGRIVSKKTKEGYTLEFRGSVGKKTVLLRTVKIEGHDLEALKVAIMENINGLRGLQQS